MDIILKLEHIHIDLLQNLGVFYLCLQKSVSWFYVLSNSNLAVVESTRFFHSHQTHMTISTSYIYHHLVDWAMYCGTVPIACTVQWWMTSHPGYLMISPWWLILAQVHGQTHLGYLMTSWKPPPSHPVMTDITMMMVTLAAGQDMWHRLCRPTS